MSKIISFIIKAEKGFLKKPDINDGIYLTYNMLHKPAILGILGAIIGLEGYKKNQVLPEYYQKLNNIPIGVKPVGDEKGNFQKTKITYNNTTGMASEEAGGNLIVTEQTLIKPSYKIYLLLDLENELQNRIYNNIKEQKAEYLPYLGKNDYSLWWDKNEMEEYAFRKFDKKEKFTISTTFKKDEAIVDFVIKSISRRSLKENIDTFNYFERLPISLNTTLYQYDYSDFAYTNAWLGENVKIDSDNLYEINEKEVVFLY